MIGVYKRNISKTIAKFVQLLMAVCLSLTLVLSISAGFKQLAFANDDEETADVAWEKTHEMKLVTPGTLTVAVSPDYPPFSYMDGDRIVGYEADIWDEIASRLGLKVEEKIMNFDAIIAAVNSGDQVDIGVAGISIDPDREELVDFSDPYYNADISFVVKENSSISRANAKAKMLNANLRYAVQSGTTGEAFVRENFPKAQVMAFNNANDCFSAVMADQADVVCSTSAVNTNLLKSTYKDMRIIREIATNEQYGIAINKDNDGLRNKVNAILSNMQEDGTISKIANKVGLSTDNNIVTKPLQTLKCTAKTNSIAENIVMGDTPTRVTYEAQASKNELVTEIDLTFPDGTSFGYEDAQATLLTGSEQLTRAVLTTEFSADGQTLKAKFKNQDELKPGSVFRIEIYNVVFPRNGGDMVLQGQYCLSDGKWNHIDDIPGIEVSKLTFVKEFAENLNNSNLIKAWNSNKFCNLFLNPGIFILSIPVVFQGFLMALLIVLIAFPLAIPLGLILALMRVSHTKVLRGIASVYVNIVRGTPLFLQIYIAFFGLPLAGIKIPSFPLGIIVLAVNSSAYLCEIFRGGIQSVPIGQLEAARSLGLNRIRAMIFVVLPQAIIRSIPTMTSEFILLYKDTSLLASVGVMEVVMFAKTIVASTGSITPYIVAALFYLVITLPLAKIINIIEQKINDKLTGKTRKKKIKNLRSKEYKRNMYFNGLGDKSAKRKINPNSWGSA